MLIFFDGPPEVIVGISERLDGSMTWWNHVLVDETVQENRNRFFVRQGIDPKRVVAGGLTHGTHVAVVNDAQAGEYLLDTDALMTNIPNLFLMITAADCMPVYFYDPRTKSIGIAHAGWRGLMSGVLEQTIENFISAFGSRASDLLVALGPCIHACHYEVGKEVADQFRSSNVLERDRTLFVSLIDEAKDRLHESGVKSIFLDTHCTYCHADRFYSARYDKIKPVQGMVGYMGINLSTLSDDNQH